MYMYYLWMACIQEVHCIFILIILIWWLIFNCNVFGIEVKFNIDITVVTTSFCIVFKLGQKQLVIFLSILTLHLHFCTRKRQKTWFHPWANVNKYVVSLTFVSIMLLQLLALCISASVWSCLLYHYTIGLECFMYGQKFKKGVGPLG